jgi:hypothetical protein
MQREIGYTKPQVRWNWTHQRFYINITLKVKDEIKPAGKTSRRICQLRSTHTKNTIADGKHSTLMKHNMPHIGHSTMSCSRKNFNIHQRIAIAVLGEHTICQDLMARALIHGLSPMQKQQRKEHKTQASKCKHRIYIKVPFHIEIKDQINKLPRYEIRPCKKTQIVKPNGKKKIVKLRVWRGQAGASPNNAGQVQASVRIMDAICHFDHQGPSNAAYYVGE